MNPLVPSASDIVASALFVAIAAYAVVAIVSLLLTRRANGLRFLFWFLIVAFVPVLGPTAWFVHGRKVSATDESTGVRKLGA